jgi:predicted ATPase
MIKKFSLNNFKAWEKTGSIRFAPITVFFGPNSSGKTSIIQSLLLLKQTVDSPDRQNVLHLGDPKTPIDLGTLSDIQYNHDSDKKLGFDIEWVLPKELKLRDVLSNARYMTDSIEFHASIGSHSQAGRPELERLEYLLKQDHLSQCAFALTKMSDENKKTHSVYQLSASEYNLKRTKGRGWPLPPPDKFYGFPEEAVAYYQNTGFLPDLTLEIERLFSRLYYVGPLRSYPRRNYTWSGEIPSHVGVQGERSIESLLAAKERFFNRGAKTRYKSFEETIARWLYDMGLIDSFDVRPIAPRRKEYEVMVRTGRRMPYVPLTDVGFGVSQILPVMVECFYVPAHAIVIFEQPEIHLHPCVQADLADLFIEAVQAREQNVGDRNIQLIVESHSEHFLRRLQRRIAEEKIGPENVAMYFCSSKHDKAVIEELQVDRFGNISNWPAYFFGDEMGDLVAMTEAAMTRQQQTGSMDNG